MEIKIFLLIVTLVPGVSVLCNRAPGATLDRKLSFKEHSFEQLKKAYAKISALRRIRRFVSLDVMIRLYKAFILPHLKYCSPLIIGVGKVQSNHLENGNYYILRTLLEHAKSAPYEQLLGIANITSLKHRRSCQSLTLLHICLYGSGPQHIRDFSTLGILVTI